MSNKKSSDILQPNLTTILKNQSNKKSTVKIKIPDSVLQSKGLQMSKLKSLTNQNPLSHNIENAYNKIINNFNKSIQPLSSSEKQSQKAAFKKREQSSSTKRLKSVSRHSNRSSSNKLLPKINEMSNKHIMLEPPQRKNSVIITANKQRILNLESKMKDQKGSQYETPTKGKHQIDTIQKQTKPYTTSPKLKPQKSSRDQILIVGNEKIQQQSKGKVYQSLKNIILENFTLEIQNYNLVTNSHEFQNFKREKVNDWPKIKNTLNLLQKFVIKYKVLQGQISYDKLISLSKKQKPSNIQIVHCFTDYQKIFKQKKIPGLEYDCPQRQTLASIKIQSYIRMKLARIYYRKLLNVLTKIIFIQRFWKRKMFKFNSKKAIKNKNIQKINHFRQLNTTFKQNWSLIKIKQRVEIHICGLSLDQLKKLTIEKIQQKQNSQINRIFKITDHFTNIIYITPFQIPEQIRSYYYKIFQIGNIADCKDRLHFLHPENYDRLPPTFSTSKLVLYSPKCIQRIKKLISGKNSFIVSGQPSLQDIQLSNALNSPLYGGDPNKHIYYGMKSGSKTLFQKLQMPVLKGAIDIYEEQQLINTLAILIYNNPNTNKWYLKIDDEVEGRGIAIINLNSFNQIKNLLKHIRQSLQVGFSEVQLIQSIAYQLKQGLQNKLKIISKGIYNSYKEYMTVFFSRGGIIQASPNITESKIKTLAINFMIQPNGEYSFIGSYEKLSTNYRTIGCVSPIQKNYEINYDHLIKTIYRQLWHKEQMFGYFTLDILVTEQPEFRMYCLGLDCYLNTFSSSIFYIQFLTNSKFNPQQNKIKLLKQEFDVYGHNNESSISINSLKSAPLEINHKTQTVYVYCPFIIHQGLKDIQTPVFFQQCRYGNISFDIKKRQGVVFVLLDLLQSLSLGVFGVGGNYLSAMKYTSNAFQFLCKNFEHFENSLTQRTDKITLSNYKSKMMIQLKKYEKVSTIKRPEQTHISLMM